MFSEYLNAGKYIERSVICNKEVDNKCSSLALDLLCQGKAVHQTC